MFGYSEAMRAFERGWRRIQEHHPEVPNAVIIIGSGGRQAASLYGHFLSNAYEADGVSVHEILIVAEQLKRPTEEIFTTLLHEATHALAEARKIKDVSGKRHNRKFATLCYEMGLEPPEEAHPSIGWSAATLKDETAERYQDVIEDIAESIKAVRKLKQEPEDKEPTSWAAECSCGRKIRVGKKIFMGFAEIDINCDVCQEPFLVDA